MELVLEDTPIDKKSALVLLHHARLLESIQLLELVMVHIDLEFLHHIFTGRVPVMHPAVSLSAWYQCTVFSTMRNITPTTLNPSGI